MIDRRKIMLASLAGVVVPVCAVFAQPAPDDRRPDQPAGHSPDQARPADHGRDQAHPDMHAEAARPRMPPPRHEVRPRAPGPEASYHWRAGHWNWSGRQWVWIGGVWYR
jgi:uncharacterized membrane protein